MQAVRRSGRLRHRLGIGRCAENDRTGASLPNLLENMGGDRNNNACMNNEAHNLQEAQINPNIGDLVPNEQGQGDAVDNLVHEGYPLLRRNACRSILMKCGMVLIGIFVITAAVLVSDLITTVILDEYPPKLKTTNSVLNSYKQDLDVCNFYSLKCNTDKQVYINKKISHLNKRLRKLNKGIEEFIKWRDSITSETKKIKNETLHKCSKQLEKFNSKIEEALTLYDADKVGMIDYALESAGGYILSTPDTKPFPSRISNVFMGIVTIPSLSSPRLLIQPGTLPGQCFAFKGSQGKIRIRLASLVDITAVTVEHVHRNLVEDMSSAPKQFEVYGLDAEDSKMGNKLGIFIYKLDEKPLQTFHIQKTNSDKTSYEFVELHILTNQGNPEYTCVYRFRVHGNKIRASREDNVKNE